MPPAPVLDILPDLLVTLDIWARLHFLERSAAQHAVPAVFLERLAGHIDGLDHSVEVSHVGAARRGAGVEVVEVDEGCVKGVSSSELDGAGAVTAVGLEGVPREVRLVTERIVAPPREVAYEIDGAAEVVEVDVTVGGEAGVDGHCGGEAVGGVGALGGQDVGVGLPFDEARVGGWVGGEGAAFEDGKVALLFDVDGDLVAVLHVGADAGEVFDDGDVELAELGGGSDAGQLEDLRRVEGAAGNDDFFGGVDGAGGAASAAQGTGAVEVLAFEVVDADGAGLSVLLDEADLGDVGIGLDGQGVTFADGVGDEFAHRGTSAILLDEGNLEEALSGIAEGIQAGVGINEESTCKTCDSIEEWWTDAHD